MFIEYQKFVESKTSIGYNLNEATRFTLHDLILNPIYPAILAHSVKREIFYTDKQVFSGETGSTTSLLRLNPAFSGEEKSKRLRTKLHGFIGLLSEMEELRQAIYKEIVDGESDPVNFKEEVGDSTFYLQMMLGADSMTINDAVEANINKLNRRYKQAFTVTEALNRDLAQEKEALQLNDKGEK